MKTSLLNRGLIAGLILPAGMCGGADLIKPERLQTPAQITCVNLTEPLSFTRQVGLMKVSWTMRLERGSYLSEKLDSRGTFFRAPPGGIRLAGNEPATEGHGRTYDGGFYLPNNPSDSVKIYFYDSNAAAPVEVPASDADCSTTGYVKDPSTYKVSLVALGIGGAVGGAAGGVAGRSLNPASRLSYGQAAGAGAAGSALAWVIIGAIANADVGKIYFPGSPKPDPEFLEKLKALAANKVLLKEIQSQEVARDPQDTAPTTNKQ
jgi:hypothetical protein